MRKDARGDRLGLVAGPNSDRDFPGTDLHFYVSNKEIMISRLHMTPADTVLMVLLLILSAASFFLVPRLVLSHSQEVEIHGGNQLVDRCSLTEDRLVDVRGPLGVTTIQVKGGRVSVLSSPCPHGVCVHMGDFGSEGGFLACVPNEVLVRVSKERADGLDAVTK